MIKKIILGVLLYGSIALAAKAPWWDVVECRGLELDLESYVETVVQMQRLSHITSILNDTSRDVELMEYIESCHAHIIHIVKEHEDSLSKKDLDILYEDLVLLLQAKAILYGDESILNKSK